MLTHKAHNKPKKLEQFMRLVERGFALEVGRWPDTPLNQGDVLLGQDPLGHVLIARAPRTV